MDEIKMSQFGEQNKLIKDLGISKDTFYRWKKEFGLPITKTQYSESEKLELLGKYYKIKQRNSRIRDNDIAKKLNIERTALYKWKKQFDPILNQNSVDKNSLTENGPTFTDNATFEQPMPSSDDTLWAWNQTKKKRTERIEVKHSVKE
uniref:Uncharacterized protein n=1 Tax=Globodera rostochiensis TaxID=31243 RepID=A0A914H843_GLORO